jgi:hypothetical protein
VLANHAGYTPRLFEHLLDGATRDVNLLPDAARSHVVVRQGLPRVKRRRGYPRYGSPRRLMYHYPHHL